MIKQYDLEGREVNKVRCSVCGRPLKSHKSILKGVGPVCEERMKNE